jgi:hypothetical protein
MNTGFVSCRCRLILPRISLAGFLMLAVLFPGFQSATAEAIVLGFEDLEQWENWQEITFPGRANTRYEFDPEGQMACAAAVASASVLLHEFPWKLEDYPILSWEWRIEHVLEKGDARTREGDDFAGRVYVNFEREERLGWWERARGRMFELIYGQELPGQSLNFIWANTLEIGEIVTSPYTEHARLVALQSGNQRAGEWVREEVNIPEQYRKAFNRAPPRVHSLAIMTDSDDTGETARACYRNINISGKVPGSAGGSP